MPLNRTEILPIDRATLVAKRLSEKGYFSGSVALIF